MRSQSGAKRVDGVLLLDKALGLSSNAAIQQVKRLFHAAKAGHVGTLDPMASGLLPVCLGEATKFSTGMFGADKTYVAEVLLGVTTTTGDAEGDVTSRREVSATHPELAAVLSRFTGTIQQTPPIYSALKRNGKPLYAYARKGEQVEIEPRPVVVHAIELLHFEADHVRLRVRCGKGTYIRVLAEDIGRELGCGASLTGLRRVGLGPFDIAQAVALQALEQMPAADRNTHLRAVDSLVEMLPAWSLDAEGSQRLLTGQACRLDGTAPYGLMRLYGPDRRFLGLGEALADGRLAPRRMVAS
jgi:tRNA pseudouridine55 synthase